MTKLLLAEPLHYVIQGEGLNVGRKMILMRVSGCNINCPDCDSKHTWNTIDKQWSLKELKNEFIKLREKYHDLSHILITGGNPELYYNEIVELISDLGNTYYWSFDLEVPGLISWPNLSSYFNRIFFNVSPKIGALYNNKTNFEYKFFNLLPLNFIVKIVTSKNTFNEDLKRIYSFIDKYYLSLKDIYLMPFGTTREQICEESQFLIEKCFEYGFNFTPRLHVLIYDNQKLV